MNDIELITSLRKCEYCHGKGYMETENHTPAAWACPHCRLTRMAADRIEKLLTERKQANDLLMQTVSAGPIAERVRERCAKECDKAVAEIDANGNGIGYYSYTAGCRNEAASRAAAIRTLTIEDLLK